MRTHFTSDRHAIGFTVALFGLCVFQTVQLLAGAGAAQTADLTASIQANPPILRDTVDTSNVRRDQQTGRLKSQRLLREQLEKQKAEAAAKQKAGVPAEHSSCATVRALMQELSCAAD